MWSDETKGSNVKDDFEAISLANLEAAALGLWYNPDPAVPDTLEFWLRTFGRHMDRAFSTWAKGKEPAKATGKVAWDTLGLLA